ncbi:MAG: glycosyltransferase family 4 protein [Gaiellaceae bacterium]|jgi:glycosyltransferase involved in cell wall biosynthesis
MPSVAFVYPNTRRELIAEWRRGVAPETNLLGLNQLGAHGFDTRVHEPRLERGAAFLPARLRWHLRELPLPRELRDVDIVFTPLANLVPLAARARRRPAVVVVNYGLNSILRRGNAARRAALRASLRSAAAVVCLGESQRNELLALAALDPDRVAVVRHGVDHLFFQPTPRPGERLVIAVGKDLARDYATLADAARALDARFVVVALRRNLDDVSLPPNVEVRERIPWTELRDLYTRADVAVVAMRSAAFTYGSEAGGVTALLEAMASGRPVVATDRPIMRDYAAGNAGIRLVEAEDADALERGILAALEDDAAGAAGRRRVEAAHTMESMATALAPVLRDAAS